MVRWGWMPLLARCGLFHTYDNHPSLMRQPWFVILQSTVGLFSKRVTFDQSDKGLIRTKGCFEKILTKSCLCQFPPNALLAPLDIYDAIVVRPSSNLGWKEGTHFHSWRHKGGDGSLWWVVIVPSGGRAGWSIDCWVKHSRTREPCDRVFVAIENWRGCFALVIALKSLVLHVVGKVYLKCISVANPYTNDQDLSLQRVTKR